MSFPILANLSSKLRPVIVMMQAAENRLRVNFPVGGIIGWGERVVVHSGVGAQSIVVMDELLEQIFEMNFPEDKEVVQALPADRGDEAFGVGIEVGGSVRDFEDAESFLLEELVKRLAELGVAVADEDSFAGRGHILGDRLNLLKNPVFVGTLGDAGDMDSPGFDVDKEEDVKGMFAQGRPDGLGEEVAGEEGVEGAFEGVGEGVFGPDAGDGDPIFNKDILDGSFADGDFKFF